jgi:hypothetical protein
MPPHSGHGRDPAVGDWLAAGINESRGDPRFYHLLRSASILLAFLTFDVGFVGARHIAPGTSAWQSSSHLLRLLGRGLGSEVQPSRILRLRLQISFFVDSEDHIDCRVHLNGLTV